MSETPTSAAQRTAALRCAGPCDHVLCSPPARPPARYVPPSERVPTPGRRDSLSRLDGPTRRAIIARRETQARGYGVLREPVSAARLRPECGCPAPDDGMLPLCYWTGEHTRTDQ